jgi:uncharacterized protein (TIGR03437 family)
LDRFKTTLVTAFVIALLFTATASAQPTAANITVVSGNGQVISSGIGKVFNYFYPMVVKVTDASGNPIAGKTVYWTFVSGIGSLPSFDPSSTTDSNGISVMRLFQSAGQQGTLSQPFLQSVINANVDSVSVNFTETVALISNATQTQLVFDNLNPAFRTKFTGPAGTTSTTPIQLHIDAYGLPVPNVSLRLWSPEVTSATGKVTLDPTTPSASCQTGPGADPGSVLTDASGNATCYPVFGTVPGSGPVSVLVGGIDPIEFDQSLTIQPLASPLAFNSYFNAFDLVVTPVTPGRVSIVSGNNQNVNPGATAAAPLVAQLTDGSGIVGIGGKTLTWTVSPAGAATVSPNSSTTDSQGNAQTTVTLSPSAAGQINIIATSSGFSTTFAVVANVQIATLAKVSGDLQSVQSGLSFTAPLVVQVNGTNGAALPNQMVSFQVTNGSANLSSGTGVTDGNGQARVTVTAGATSGPLSVRASIVSLSQTFTLTVIPPGPILTNDKFYTPGGGARVTAFAPCGLVTVITTGLAPNVQGLVLNSNAFGPWSTTVASDTVTVNTVAAPIFSVGNVGGAEQLTFQVPCELLPTTSAPVTINVGGGTATVNMPIVAASPGILETVMSDGVRRAVALRPDGTYVSLQNPARGGEIIRILATGMGSVAPTLVTGGLPVPGTDSLVLSTVIVGVNNGGARVVTSRAAPNLIGVYEVAFQVPSDAPSGNDVILSVAVNAPGDSQTRFSNGSKLPIVQ